MSLSVGLDLDLTLIDTAGPGAVERFRALYVDHAVSAPVVPGAHEALVTVHALGARTVVVTGTFEPSARRHPDSPWRWTRCTAR